MNPLDLYYDGRTFYLPFGQTVEAFMQVVTEARQAVAEAGEGRSPSVTFQTRDNFTVTVLVDEGIPLSFLTRG